MRAARQRETKNRTNRTESFVGIVLFVLLAIVIAVPRIRITRCGYFDVNNGRRRDELVVCGCVLRQSIEETKYSKLLKNLGFKELSPDWKLAYQDDKGLLSGQFADYSMGEIESSSEAFALAIDLNKIDEAKARAMAERFRTLARKGDSSEVSEYVSGLSYGDTIR